jgi:hypothetical protein
LQLTPELFDLATKDPELGTERSPGVPDGYRQYPDAWRMTPSGRPIRSSWYLSFVRRA